VSIIDEVRPPGPPTGSGPPPDRFGEPAMDRTPPQDIAAEQCVLGGMLLSKDAIADVVEILRSGDFYRPAHAKIFDTVLDLYGRGEPADPITVAAALTDAGDLVRIGGASYLHTLISSVPTAANSSYYARIVAERAVLRRLVEAGTRIVQMGYGSAAGQGRDVDDVVDLAQQAIYDVTERRAGDDYAILADLLQPALDEIEAVGSREGMMAGVPTGFGDLDRLLNGLHPGQLIIVAGRPGLGKALALDTPLPTPDGWTTMGAVRVGDRLLDAAGRPTTVTALSETRIGRACYEVEFCDGSVIVADGAHRWLTSTGAPRAGFGNAAVVTTEQIRATLHIAASGTERSANHSVAVAQALALPERELAVAPYTLGVWLGAGDGGAARFSTADDELVVYVEADGYEVRSGDPSGYRIELAPSSPRPERDCAICGKSLARRRPGDRTCGRFCRSRAAGTRPASDQLCAACDELVVGRATGIGPAPRRPAVGRSISGRSLAVRPVRTRRCTGCETPHDSMTMLLGSLDVLGDKHIPAAYLRASIDQRRSLLAGLLDADGTVAPDGDLGFQVTSRRLAEDIRELVVGLGYRCSVTPPPVPGRGAAYAIGFSTSDELFRLERKRLVHKDRCRTRDTTGDGRRSIVDVRPVRTVPVRCVSVDNAEHLYLAGRSMIPTHNSTASMDFARHAAVRHNMASAIFSLEMSKIEIVTRLLSAEARVPLHVLRSGQLSDDDWTRLARRMGEISEAPIFVDDTPNMNLMEIRAKARRMKQRHDLRLVVVDYLQLMSSPKRVESRQQEVAELSRGLKLLAKEIECPVIAVSQLNRGPEQRTDKRPQLSDLRESGSIEQDADVVILLHRDDYYDKESPRAGEADFIVAKHRNGPTDTITVAAQLHFSRFVDMAIS
jgi:replicative DNA helicase